MNELGDRNAFQVVGATRQPVPARAGVQDAPVAVEFEHGLLENGERFQVGALLDIACMHLVHHDFQGIGDVVDLVVCGVCRRQAA